MTASQWPDPVGHRLDVDVLVVGGGPGGTPAAMALAQAGRRVLLAEVGAGLGGTCLFEGCIPSKIFRETARRLADIREAASFGIAGAGDDARPDWAQVQARKEAILAGRSQAAAAVARAIPGLTLASGRIELTGPRAAVLKAPGSATEVTFRQAILAPGSVPARPDIPGADLAGVLDSGGLIGTEELPASLTVIGAGPVGVEMAQIFHGLGTRVTLLEMAPAILPSLDDVLAARLAGILDRDGLTVRTGVRVTGIEQDPDGLVVGYADAAGRHRARAGDVLFATGRRPATDGLGLDAAGISYDRHAIKTDEHLQTTQPGIYATGDAAGPPMFAHWATAQAHAVADRILGRPGQAPSPAANTAVIFTDPELGTAGLTEPQARAAGYAAATAEYDYRADARAQIAAPGPAGGLLRIVYDRPTGRILGVHVLADGAADLMGEAAVAVSSGLTISDLAHAIHPHPTLTEAFGLAAATAEATA
ncbi:MAG: dihydrolipoyl dehydrogenase family protein [Streptosporangiaceae bacterium]